MEFEDLFILNCIDGKLYIELALSNDCETIQDFIKENGKQNSFDVPFSKNEIKLFYKIYHFLDKTKSCFDFFEIFNFTSIANYLGLNIDNSQKERIMFNWLDKKVIGIADMMELVVPEYQKNICYVNWFAEKFYEICYDKQNNKNINDTLKLRENAKNHPLIKGNDKLEQKINNIFSEIDWKKNLRKFYNELN